MTASHPRECFVVRGKAGSSMRLPLHSEGDYNGNAFPISSSSSSSNSCFGDLSQESQQSLSLLSGGLTDSPSDYDMLEVAVVRNVMAKMDRITNDVLSWEPEEENIPDNRDLVLGKTETATELSESNDNCISVYLDTNSEHHQDIWKDNLTLSLSLTNSGSQGNINEISSGSINGKRCGSTTQDSGATEVPADDHNEEREAFFLSVSSEMTLSTSNGQPSFCVAVMTPEDLKTRQTSTCPCSPSTANNANKATSALPEIAERCSKAAANQTVRAGKTKSTTGASPAPRSTSGQPPGPEPQSVPRQDPKFVKAKAGLRSTHSPHKIPSQNKCAPVNGRRPVLQKETAQMGVRPPTGAVKAAMVLKPVRGNSCNFKTRHKKAASDLENLAISQTLLSSTSFPGSELHEVIPLESARKTASGVPDGSDTAEGVEPSQPRETMKDPREVPENVLIVAVEKLRNLSAKVSSKLGPSVKQQTRGIRPDQKPSGSKSGFPGHVSPRLIPAHGESSTLREGVSPVRGRQSQIHIQGIPKPRTTTERAFNQQPASRSVGRSAATTSKLPVKGLPTSLSSSSLGSNENSGTTSKVRATSPTRTKLDERLSRSTLPVGSQNPAKTLITTNTGAPADTVTGTTSGASKYHVMRSRALSLQARTAASGVKTLTVPNHSTSKTSHQPNAKTSAAASHGSRQASQYPLQKSSSVRFSQVRSTVDKNKPQEATARPRSTNITSQGTAASAQNQNQQQPPSDWIPNVANGNAPVTPAPPEPVTDNTNTGSGTPRASGVEFKARTGSRSIVNTGSHPHNASKPRAADGVKQNYNDEQAEKKTQAIIQLRRLLVQGNKRVEALATVIQHLFTEREEARKQKKELSRELANLQDELVTLAQSCNQLQKEKEDVHDSMKETMKTLQEQHKEDLEQLENRLKSFYQTEWDKVHKMYQEEADKCHVLMEEQVEKLKSQQEAEKKNQEISHSQIMGSLKMQYETSIGELKMIHQTDRENLEKTLIETETSLSNKISALSAENEALSEKLKEEEENRKHILTTKSLKDSHTVYLEQELESLKVVLELKNNQLHQKEKKLMEMDKLVETNVKLEECLKKIQQENEDYKARMDKHAALSKQLSNEQAILQQTLQKESKVNKRLSMENEELLWKLHNGDLSSPRRLSPTSPFSSPRNSVSFTATTPLSPR